MANCTRIDAVEEIKVAYNFDQPSAEWFDTGTTSPVSGSTGISFACWIRFTGGQSFVQTVMSLGTAGSGDNRISLAVLDTTTDAIALLIRDTSSLPISGTVLADSNWHHVGVVNQSATDHRLYLDGALDASSTTSKSISAPNSFYVGNANNDGVQTFHGDIAEVGLWDVDIGLAGMQKLANGLSPQLVRVPNLKFYMRLRATVEDRVGGLTITTNGTPTSATHKDGIKWGQHRVPAGVG